MGVYLFNLIWTMGMSALAVKFAKDKHVDVLGMKKKLPNSFFIALILISFMSFYALRWEVGTDFTNYYFSYFYYGGGSFDALIKAKEWGFTALTFAVYRLWPENFVFYNYILAAITYIPVVYTFRKHARNFTFTLTLYITMMTYYWAYNGVRQSIACGICFAAYPLLHQKKYFKYLLCVFIAYTFHSTAILMIPVMFIVTRKPWSKLTAIILASVGISLLFLTRLWSEVISLLRVIGQERLAQDYSILSYTDNGVSFLRIVVVIIPLIIAFLFYKQLKGNNPKIDLLINMSLMCAVFMIFASKVTIIARLSNYFVFFNALLIPEFSVLFKKSYKPLFQGITIILFFIYMCMLLPVDSNLLPYTFILNR